MLDSVDAQRGKKVDEWAALFQKIFLLPEQAQKCAFGKSIILAYHDFRGCQRGAKGEFFLRIRAPFGQCVPRSFGVKLGCITIWKMLIIIDKTGNFPWHL